MREQVSVVIPVRDGERYLGAAIDSVLAQTHRPLEVVVVDDGSTDATCAVAAAFGPPVRVVSQAPAGVGPAVNRGFELAGGDLLASIDADDLWPADKLERQTAVLRERDDLDAVFGQVAHFTGDDPGETPGPVQPGISRGTMLIRRAALRRAGPISGEWRLGEFIEWYARAVDSGLSCLVLPDVDLLRRVHEGNMGVRLRDEQAEYARVLKAVLDRRRGRR